MIYFSTFCVKIELIVVLWLLEHEISIGCFNTFVPDSRTSMYYVTKNDITLYFFRYNLAFCILPSGWCFLRATCLTF